MPASESAEDEVVQLLPSPHGRAPRAVGPVALPAMQVKLSVHQPQPGWLTHSYGSCTTQGKRLLRGGGSGGAAGEGGTDGEGGTSGEGGANGDGDGDGDGLGGGGGGDAGGAVGGGCGGCAGAGAGDSGEGGGATEHTTLVKAPVET